MKKNKISNKIIFISLTFLTFIFYWYGKEITSYLDSKWLLKYPKHYSIPFAIYTTTFVKWLINEASFGLFTFNDLTRFFAWIALNFPCFFEVSSPITNNSAPQETLLCPRRWFWTFKGLLIGYIISAVMVLAV